MIINNLKIFQTFEFFSNFDKNTLYKNNFICTYKSKIAYNLQIQRVKLK